MDNNNDFTWWFIVMSLINTNLGVSNVEKNNLQEQRQKNIELKLDKILNILEGNDE